MGEQSTALTKRSSDTSLMPPPPMPKRIKRPTTVLDEYVYTNALEHIIARDFFPGLVESKAQQEYLDSLESNNEEWIREAGRKLTQAMTPGPDGRRGRRGVSMTPLRSSTTARTPVQTPGATPRGWTGATPSARGTSVASSFVEEDENPSQKVDRDLSLSAFQAKYTSEDNESFNSLLDKQNAKRLEKYAFFHNGNKILAPRQIAHRNREKKLLENSASSSQALIPRPSADQDARPASYDSFTNRQGPRNSFMFSPDSVEDTHKTTAQLAQERSLAPPKSVSLTSTRFPGPVPSDSTTDPTPPTPSLSAVDDAIAGRPRPTASEPGYDYDGSATPRVNGYAFIDAEPTPSELGIPIDDEEVRLAEREAALALMPALDTDNGGGAGSFKLQRQSKREEIHHRLVDKNDASRRKGDGGGKAGSRLLALRDGGGSSRTPTPKFMSSPAASGLGTPRAGAGTKKAGVNLTPAAQRLADSMTKTPGRAPGSGFDGAKRSNKDDGRNPWTPVARAKKAG